MTGLSVLYAREAAEERDWVAIPDRDMTGRLWEVYWARRAASKSRRKPFAKQPTVTDRQRNVHPLGGGTGGHRGP